MEKQYLKSSFREKLIEHLFIGELLKLSWSKQDYLEISRPEVDSSGYDIIVETNDIIRHIQIKASHKASSTRSQKVNMALTKKPSACVVWIYFDADSLKLGPFLFFGGNPGEPLPDMSDFKVAKHTKGNAKGNKAERPNIRVVNRSQFKKYNSIKELYDQLLMRSINGSHSC
ncbi:MAG: hypothetical protein FJ134_14400 [Deltaproteobacteria bacterium]|nr:hypothetical protein [Deltaproteobacteria bacterium]